MAGLAESFGVLVETFGVFLLPAAIFTVGIGLYALLWALGRLREES